MTITPDHSPAARPPTDEPIVRDPSPDESTDHEPTDRAVQAPLLGGRHRLRVQVGAGVTELWRADDEVLARPVAVRLLRGPRPEHDTEAYLEAATRAGQVGHPRVSRVLDAFSVPGQHLDVIVTEWVDRTTLTELLQDGPLSPEAATVVLRQVLSALSAIHQSGAAHGRLHARNVHATATGDVVVTDPEVAAALAGTLPPPDSREAEAADVRAAGAVYYAALTGRWPLPADRGRSGGTGGLPAAPRVAGHVRTPRQVRAGVPREADELAMHLLGRGDGASRLVTLAAATRAAVGVADGFSVTGPVAPAARRRVPRWVKLSLSLLLIAGVGIAGWLLGLQVGQPPARSTPSVLPTISDDTTGTPTAPGVAAWPVTAATAYDPLGDGKENSDKAALAIDGDPSTAWPTSRYKTAALGGLKDGVGLLLDLGRPRTVGAARLLLTVPGADVQLRAATGSTAPADVDGFDVVANATAAPAQTDLTLATPTTARYWLVWFTSLPKDGDGYRTAVAEAQLLGAPAS